MTTTEQPTTYGELTNLCTCLAYDDDGAEIALSDCLGDCWDDSVYAFGLAVEHLLSMSDTFSVTDLRLWDGEVSGVFYARSASELLSGMTVRSAWTMNYEVYSDRVEYSLSHHDAPYGSTTTLRPIMEETE